MDNSGQQWTTTHGATCISDFLVILAECPNIVPLIPILDPQNKQRDSQPPDLLILERRD